ncbi:hypothetical protein J2Y66_003058 [Paenarthrobacter nitroguajacolicus]|nr:hypothetical protein [Paenarthrobacter nitroguajacolicus]
MLNLKEPTRLRVGSPLLSGVLAVGILPGVMLQAKA